MNDIAHSVAVFANPLEDLCHLRALCVQVGKADVKATACGLASPTPEELLQPGHGFSTFLLLAAVKMDRRQNRAETGQNSQTKCSLLSSPKSRLVIVMFLSLHF